jgi:chemotaxis protein methyltransferase CheR
MGRRPKIDARNDIEAIEIECFLLALFRRYGYDLRGYDPEFIKAQVALRIREEELESVSRLSEALLRDSGILARFLGQFAPPPSALFQPARFWAVFREKVVPFLRTYPTLRFWLVGARPEEIYSLSILLEEDLPRHVQIYATDIHETLLDRARGGSVPSDQVERGVKAYRQSGGRRSLNRYFERSNGSAVFSPELRKKILFGSHNPVTDGTFQQCHVILARNLLELFSEDLRERTYRLLHQSLVPLGFLALGPKDDLKSSGVKEDYKEVDAAVNLFQKVRGQPT